ncbi:MAG: hypothetical protein OXC05_12555 [Halieaceae bacterium]|nr:hypothetical protein [Halieaceae bacterium]
MSNAVTIRQGKLRERKLRLVRRGIRFYGLANGVICTEGLDADDVWRRLHDDAGKSDPRYFGYDGARARFQKFFPNGFHSEGFASQERTFKLELKKKLDSTAPLEQALEVGGLGESVLAVYRSNLLSPYEVIPMQNLLRGPNADSFIQAAARFATNATSSTLLELDRVLKPHDCAKWTIATYLPFLWQPESHMFLKPEATKDFAVRVGHSFASVYESRLDFDVYASLLNLADKTASELIDLAPRDQIDIQSFIWIVGYYREDREAVYP